MYVTLLFLSGNTHTHGHIAAVQNKLVSRAVVELQVIVVAQSSVTMYSSLKIVSRSMFTVSLDNSHYKQATGKGFGTVFRLMKKIPIGEDGDRLKPGGNKTEPRCCAKICFPLTAWN